MMTDLKSYELEKDLRNGDGFAECSCKLYKVSEQHDLSSTLEADLTKIAIFKLIQGSVRKLRFKLQQSYARVYDIQNECIVKIQCPMLTESNELLGAIIFEQPNHYDVTLNWYFTSLNES